MRANAPINRARTPPARLAVALLVPLLAALALAGCVRPTACDLRAAPPLGLRAVLPRALAERLPAGAGATMPAPTAPVALVEGPAP